MNPKDRIIIPIDTIDIDQALRIVNTLSLHVGMFKVGLEFLTSIIVQLAVTNDSSFVQKVQCLFKMVEGQLFWDGKWSDISNTIKGASIAVAPINPKFFNVHASCGQNSVKAAVENRGSSSVLGVTVLTSLSEPECISIFGDKPGKKVLDFAKLLVDSGAQGIICSPKELCLLSENGFNQLIKVTPGVRPIWAAVGDQRRVMTPKEAIVAGADYLVIGRPITAPSAEIGSPSDAVNKIIEEIGEC